jgi:hypothetical protein
MNPIVKHSRSKVGFADLYLERYGSGSSEELPDADPDLFLIVTIPAFKEPDLAASILSLLSCEPPGVKWEILININYPENAALSVIDASRQSWVAAQQISSDLSRADVRIHCLWNPDMPARHAGVGLARKIVMDQAVHRFNRIGRADGVIVSFDADSCCDQGYLKTVAQFYLRNPRVRTANIYFEHPLSGGFDPKIYHSIAQYELYLRYMRLAIEETGHPHGIHTVGSSFSVTGKTYIRVNGMGRDKAGEDFYFLHKCIQLKNFWEINETAVWPSVRESDRVSFGTGATIHQLQNETTLEVYNFDSFQPLKELFGRVSLYWQLINDNRQPEENWETLSPGLVEFLKSQDGSRRFKDMHRDSASEETFKAKFFAWFNGFMVLRYLNEMQKKYFMKAPVLHEASRLAGILGIAMGESAEEMLIHFRDFEKRRGNRRII